MGLNIVDINAFCSTFTNVFFYFCHVFVTFFNVLNVFFFNFLNVFLHLRTIQPSEMSVDRTDYWLAVGLSSLARVVGYLFMINFYKTDWVNSAVCNTYREDGDPTIVGWALLLDDVIRKGHDPASDGAAMGSDVRVMQTATTTVDVTNQHVHLQVIADTCHCQLAQAARSHSNYSNAATNVECGIYNTVDMAVKSPTDKRKILITQ